MQRTLFVAALLCAAPPAALAADTYPAGYTASQLPSLGGALARTLSSGDLVTFDGQTVQLTDATGAPKKVLHDFGGPLFTGCFAVDPTETFAIVGETSSQGVWRVPLSGVGAVQIATLQFNYDAAWAPSGELYLSAATCGWFCGNDVLRLDPATGATTKVAFLQGASGPIDFDTLGNLYYATVSDAWPTPPGASDVLIFPAALLAAADCGLGTCLTETDAIPYSTGFDGATDLLVRTDDGSVYLAQNDYGAGTDRIWRVGGGGPQGSTVLVDGIPGGWISGLEATASNSAAVFQAFQPDHGAGIVYVQGGAGTRPRLAAARPSLSLSGAGLSGPGAVQVDLVGGLPGAGAFLLYGPSWLVSASETGHLLPIAGAPLFTGLDLGALQVLPTTLPVDAAGQASYGFVNPGGLEGLVTVQGLLFQPSGLLGTSNSAPF